MDNYVIITNEHDEEVHLPRAAYVTLRHHREVMRQRFLQTALYEDCEYLDFIRSTLHEHKQGLLPEPLDRYTVTLFEQILQKANC